jgi:hypothetical protein
MGGLNLYGFVVNCPSVYVDLLGLDLNLLPVYPNIVGPNSGDQNNANRQILRDERLLENRYFEVHAHGDCCGAYDDRKSKANPDTGRTDITTGTNRVRLTPQELAKMINDSGKYKKGQIIRLWICYAGGVTPNGEINLAQQFADELAKLTKDKVYVQAPNSKVGLGKDNQFTPEFKFPNDGKEPGFKPFYGVPPQS